MRDHGEEGQILLASEAMTFEQVLHKGTSKDVGLGAMMKKDREAQRAASDAYFKHWDNKTAKDETAETRAERVADYETIARQYYNLATDFYEYGWSQSFHFARAAKGEPLKQSLARHEHYLAHMARIKKDMKVLDVGCGVGGPAREIAKFTGAYITGLNLNEYQVSRAQRYAAKEKLDNQCQFIQGDFMNIPFEKDTFDAVYVIEATVHAPSLEAVYSEIYRVLKPGGVFAVYEWVMTSDYDNDNLEHRRVRIDIEQGNGVPNMVKSDEALRAIQAAGFELLAHEDLAYRPDPSPWYWPLSPGSWRHAQTLGELVYTFPMSHFGRAVTHYLLGALETLRIAPPGMVKTSTSLVKAADALVEGGRDGIFTPMYLMVGRKPVADQAVEGGGD